MNRLKQLIDLKQEMIEAFPVEERNMVFGRGHANASLMLIGEAPGAQEDAMGLPFVGSAGTLLEGLLLEANIEPVDVYITNLLKWRPPENRDPEVGEVTHQYPWLIRQICIVKPRLIVALGAFATQKLLGTKARITDVHGQHFLRRFQLGNDDWSANVLPALHPAAALRQGRMKDMLRSDIKTAVRLLVDG